MHRVDLLHALFDRDPGGILRARTETARVIDEFAPEVIHLHPCGPEIPFFLHAQDKRHIPSVATLHNNYRALQVDFTDVGLFGRALTGVERIAAVSDDARQWLLSVRPDLAAKVLTIHNGIPDMAAAPAPLPWHPPSVLYVGRIEAQKRIDVLVRAFALVASRHTSVRLRIAGSGSQLREVVALGASLGLDDRVEFLGRVEPSEVVALLDDATVVVMSSDFEGLPIALLEAARHGRAVVSTSVGGVPEVVVDGETGRLVAPDAPDALARAILELLDDPCTTEAYGRAARVKYATSFALDTCASAYERLYECVVHEPRRRDAGLVT